MRVHVIGIGGSGMRPLVPHLLARGDTVTGSDRAYDPSFQHPVFRTFLDMGVALFPQDGAGAREAEAAVVSTAVEEQVPDFALSRARGIPVWHRSVVLAQLADAARGAGRAAVGVAGTSGKTTTAGMIGWILERAGLDPGVYLGGSVIGWPGIASARVGKGPFVFEADESDGSIERLTASLAVLTTVSEDHMSVAEVRGLLLRFAQRAGRVVAGEGILREIGYGGGSAVPVEEEAGCSIPGGFNRRNAALALAAARALGVAEAVARRALLEFPGMSRRLEPVSARVFDDYAHNPEKVASVLEALREVGTPLLVIYQPHGYRPARMLMQALAAAFAAGLGETGRVIFLPIFDAGGTTDRTISSEDLAAAVRAKGARAEAMNDRPTARALAREVARKVLAEGGAVCVMGARDESLSDFAREIALGSLGAG